MTKQYITRPETAKLIRKQLKVNFSGIKFSVRSKDSIRIGWTDGPTDDAVQEVVSAFSGQNFDGMIDMRYYTTSWLLPDGSVQFAKSGGTESSLGSAPAFENDKPHPNAIEVMFGVDFIFTNRDVSVEALTMIAADVSKYYDFEMPEIGTYDDVIGRITSKDVRIDNMQEWSNSLVYQQMEKTDLHDLSTYKSLYTVWEEKEAVWQAEQKTIEVEQEQTVKVELEVIENPLIETARFLLKSMSPGDTLNTLMGGGLTLNAALEILKQC